MQRLGNLLGRFVGRRTAQTPPPVKGMTTPGKRALPALLFCVFFGVFGAHRFYAGKRVTGILQLLTFGGLGLWALVDLIMIVAGVFRDKAGNRITQ